MIVLRCLRRQPYWWGSCNSDSSHLKCVQLQGESLSTSESYSFSDVTAVFSRRYIHQNIALEIFLCNKGKGGNLLDWKQLHVLFHNSSSLSIPRV